MKKIVKKWGTSFVLILSPEDAKIYHLDVDDIVDIKLRKVKNTDGKKTR
jgi:hypothetical protein